MDSQLASFFAGTPKADSFWTQAFTALKKRDEVIYAHFLASKSKVLVQVKERTEEFQISENLYRKLVLYLLQFAGKHRSIVHHNCCFRKPRS